MILDLSEVKKIAVLCGAYISQSKRTSLTGPNYYIDEVTFSGTLQSFAQAIYAIGAAKQKEKDAKICMKYYEGKTSPSSAAKYCAEAIRSQE